MIQWNYHIVLSFQVLYLSRDNHNAVSNYMAVWVDFLIFADKWNPLGFGWLYFVSLSGLRILKDVIDIVCLELANWR